MRQALSFLIPGRLEARTGGYEYDRQIAAAARRRGAEVRVMGLDGSYPFPTSEARTRSAAALAGLPDGGVVLVDGLAYGAMADEANAESSRLCLVALVHHPLADETGLDPARAAVLLASERRALQAARLVVVTSGATARTLVGRFDVPAARLRVVEPGTPRAPLASGSPAGTPLQLLCVATLIPRKGHDVLVQALSPLRHLPWRLTCVGSTSIDPPTAAAVRRAVTRQGFDDRVAFVDEADDAAMQTFYDRADVLVMPTRYEGYGMAVAEALARGLPVIGTPTGAIPSLVGRDAGVLVPIDDVPALTTALRTVLEDPAARARLQHGAHRVRETLPTWDDQAGRLLDALVFATTLAPIGECDGDV